MSEIGITKIYKKFQTKEFDLKGEIRVAALHYHNAIMNRLVLFVILYYPTAVKASVQKLSSALCVHK